jgi:hypothetical protein
MFPLSLFYPSLSSHGGFFSPDVTFAFFLIPMLLRGKSDEPLFVINVLDRPLHVVPTDVHQEPITHAN